ncbi:MAG: hypothetical protein IKD04_02955 [Clostridia bacterium]|nr:hypothetical protein [Clostridia bacterium]
MLSCTFFGHRYTPKEIEPTLRSALFDLIENKNVTVFYVGNQGYFDSMARQVLKDMKKLYPHINYSVVLAYMPGNRAKDGYRDFSDTMYPDGLEKVPQKYAIDKRNRWMIDKSDYVVTYVRGIGGAYKYKEISEKKGKTVINL